MSNLQTALKWFDTYELANDRTEQKMLLTIRDAARLVANVPTYKWCEVHHSGVNWRTGTDIMQDVERCDAHRLLAMPGQEATVAACEVIVAAVFAPQGATEHEETS